MDGLNVTIIKSLPKMIGGIGLEPDLTTPLFPKFEINSPFLH